MHHVVHHVVHVVKHRDLGESCLFSRAVCNVDVRFQAVRTSAVVTAVTYAVEIFLYLLSSLHIDLLVNI